MKLTTLVSISAAAILATGCNQNSDQTSNATSTNQTASYSSSTPGTNGDTNVDNTRINRRDRNNANPTALDQGNSDADIKTSASIRKMIVSGTNDFSMTAKNIKIITQNGKVTLRGPVISDAEKTKIEAIAKETAGDGNVENDLEVKTTQ